MVIYGGFAYVNCKDHITFIECANSWEADVFAYATWVYLAGYGVFGTGALMSWRNDQYDGDYGTDTIKDCNFAGSVLFTIGSLLYCIAAVKPWPNKDYSPSCEDSVDEFVFGKARIFYGGFCFLAGSVLFCFAAAHGRWDDPYQDVDVELDLWQTGILFYVLGRWFFLFDAIYAVRAGKEARYGGSGQYLDDLQSAMSIAFRLTKSFRTASERVHKRSRNQAAIDSGVPEKRPEVSKLDLPGGSWKRKAVTNSDTQQTGRVEFDGKQNILVCEFEHPKTKAKQTIRQPFVLWDTFTPKFDEENGAPAKWRLEQGCTAGLGCLATTGEIIDLCDFFDELDFSATGMLTAPDLHILTDAIGQNLSVDKVEKLVRDLDQDGGEDSEGKVGLDFIEFMAVFKAKLDPKMHRHNMQKAWKKVNADNNEFVTKKEFEELICALMGVDYSKNKAHVDAVTDEFFEMYNHEGTCHADGGSMTKAQFFDILTGDMCVLEDKYAYKYEGDAVGDKSIIEKNMERIKQQVIVNETQL
jgi:Ca2+-binding EF-hand superfamily protein